MIDALISIIDRLIKLKEYRDELVDKRFNDVLKPVFEDLLLVHRDYVDMFTHVVQLLSIDSNSDEQTIQEQAIAAVDYLRKRRIELEPVRVKIRAMIKQLRSVDLGDEGDQFIRAIRSYLSPISESDCLSGILGDKGLHSHSMGMLMDIQEWLNKKDVEMAALYVQKHSVDGVCISASEGIDELRKKWAEVCEAFASLKLASNLHI